MFHNAKVPRTDLWFVEKGSEPGIVPNTPASGKRWLELLAKHIGLTHAWIGWVDESRSVRWVADLSPDPIPPQFTDSVLEDVIVQGEVFTFRDHEELTGGGLFPLIHDGQVRGLLAIVSDQSDYFKTDTVRWICTLNEVIANNLSGKKTVARERGAEYTISRILQSSLDVCEGLPAVLECLTGELEADAATVLQYSPLPRRFELLMTHGLERAALAKLNLHFDIGLVRRSFEDRSLWIEDLRALPLGLQPITRLDEDGFRGYLALPLMAHDQLVGALEIAWLSPRHTKTWDDDFLDRVTEPIAFAMERTLTMMEFREKNSELAARYNAMIEGLSRALELRDLETEGHTRRVSSLVIKLVEHMHIPSDRWDAIRQGALLHDIGKIGIPDAILLKPGSLNTQEKRVMQQHVTYGYNILAPIIHIQDTLDITLYHHERWDGKGYPSGLKGEQIPLVARLFAAVDVFDALSSDRPYRSAWSRAQVLEYLRRESGRQFDPQVVQYFLEVAGGSA